MSAIKILSDDVSNRIAAGEVVERPASIVKELMENSLDAGAGQVSIIVERAGRKLISITDDGRGMDADDALLCLEPHATSKISSITDMDEIATMGFRGEALPSIASVSRLKLQTKPENSIEGTEILVEGGRMVSAVPAGCAKGTSVAVRDLFFNTPARRKFLRSDSTEERHIVETVTMLALSRADVGIDLTIDGKVVVSVGPDGGLPARIQSLLGKRTLANFIPANYERSGISISGFIAKHGFTKKSRREQRVFVNRRPVEAPAIYRGLANGYESLVMRGEFPPVVLFIEMASDRVDVNVHPAKREVRFKEDALVGRIVSEAVMDALRSSSSPTASVSSALSMDAIIGGAAVDYAPPVKAQPSFDGLDPADGVALPEIHPEIPRDFETPGGIPALEGTVGTSSAMDTLPPTEERDSPRLRVLAFLDNTYILAGSDDGLVVIDQHAAHERVLFERLMAGSATAAIPVQRLLIPAAVDVSRSEVLFVERNAALFRELGFELEAFGKNTIVLRSVPAALSDSDAVGLLTGVLAGLTEDGTPPKNLDKAAIARTACSMAVKANDQLTIEEAESLLREMGKCRLPYSCPHGRPTMISISRAELEKRFGRR